MAWQQLALIAARDRVPLVEAVLENAGALSITLDEPDADPQSPLPADLSLLEPAPGATPLWALVRITALFEDSPQTEPVMQQAVESLAEALAAPPHIETLADQVWERVWLSDWKPQRFGDRLWICPHGQRAPAEGAVVVSLDPGLAFGTGSHPTTALCLEWLDALPLQGKTVIDYGCGSGILAIAALKLGASQALAVDHDDQALTATTVNASANGVADRLRCCAPDELPDGSADVLLANILAGVLVELAPRLKRLCRVDSRIGLSGILEPQVPAVRAAYQDAVAFDPPLVRAQWALLRGRHCR